MVDGSLISVREGLAMHRTFSASLMVLLTGLAGCSFDRQFLALSVESRTLDQYPTVVRLEYGLESEDQLEQQPGLQRLPPVTTQDREIFAGQCF